MDLALLEVNLVTATFWASLISFLLFLASVVFKRTDSQKSLITSYLGYAGMWIVTLSSTAALVVKGMITGHVPWSNFYESMVLMTALAAGMFLVTHRIYKNDLLGLVMSPGIAVLVGIASILPKNYRGNEPLVPALQSYWIKIHTTAMIVSYSVFLLATTTAIAYIVLSYINSNKQGGNKEEVGTSDVKLKSLSLSSATAGGPDLNMMTATADSLGLDLGSPKSTVSRVKNSDSDKHDSHLSFFDDLTYRFILLGFPILAFGIITGAMWANHAWGTYWSWDPKETASLMTWLFYAAYLHSRVGMKITGRKSAMLAIFAFASVIFTYYGVNYLPGLHSYGFAT